MKNLKTKSFDCIAMKREAQKAIRAKVRGMTRDEELAFFRAAHEDFEKRVQAAKQGCSARPSSEGS